MYKYYGWASTSIRIPRETSPPGRTRKKKLKEKEKRRLTTDTDTDRNTVNRFGDVEERRVRHSCKLIIATRSLPY